jgi:protein-serine/threonine kinase
MSTVFQSNIHRLAAGDIWISDHTSLTDLSKPQTSSLRTSNSLCMSNSSTTSSNSSLASVNYPHISRQSSARRHRAETGSLKEYGECYRRLGQGTTAVVMVVRQLDKDGRSQKLYAIKQFRKKQKHESEKEYMKKLTSEFCISSTFTHPNIVETIDLVLDEKKRYCTVMEYVKY